MHGHQGSYLSALSSKDERKGVKLRKEPIYKGKSEVYIALSVKVEQKRIKLILVLMGEQSRRW